VKLHRATIAQDAAILGVTETSAITAAVTRLQLSPSHLKKLRYEDYEV
jgi:hypothetical protein